MKKLFILFLMSTSVVVTVQAQDAIKHATSTASTTGFNVKSLTTSIMNKLVPALTITDDQKPGVTDAISGFLVQKSKILPLKFLQIGFGVICLIFPLFRKDPE